MEVITTYLDDGGWVMYVILAVSVLGVLIFVERLYGLYIQNRLNARAFIRQVVTHVENRRFREALDMCEISSRHPLGRVMKAGILRANRRDVEIERAMESEMLASLLNIRKRISLMALLANSSTLLGLLGTIFGLISAFASISMASAAARQDALAAGISTAMYTTAFGISVAVPLLVFHHILSNRSENILIETEGGATTLMVALTGVVREIRSPNSAKTDGSTEIAS